MSRFCIFLILYAALSLTVTAQDSGPEKLVTNGKLIVTGAQKTVSGVALGTLGTTFTFLAKTCPGPQSTGSSVIFTITNLKVTPQQLDISYISYFSLPGEPIAGGNDFKATWTIPEADDFTDYVASYKVSATCKRAAADNNYIDFNFPSKDLKISKVLEPIPATPSTTTPATLRPETRRSLTVTPSTASLGTPVTLLAEGCPEAGHSSVIFTITNRLLSNRPLGNFLYATQPMKGTPIAGRDEFMLIWTAPINFASYVGSYEVSASCKYSDWDNLLGSQYFNFTPAYLNITKAQESSPATTLTTTAATTTSAATTTTATTNSFTMECARLLRPSWAKLPYEVLSSDRSQEQKDEDDRKIACIKNTYYPDPPQPLAQDGLGTRGTLVVTPSTVYHGKTVTLLAKGCPDSLTTHRGHASVAFTITNLLRVEPPSDKSGLVSKSWKGVPIAGGNDFKATWMVPNDSSELIGRPGSYKVSATCKFDETDSIESTENFNFPHVGLEVSNAPEPVECARILRPSWANIPYIDIHADRNQAAQDEADRKFACIMKTYYPLGVFQKLLK